MVVAASANGLKDTNLVMSLYLNPLKDFENIMDMTIDHMIMDEALQSFGNEAPQPSSTKKTMNGKGKHKKPERPRTPPPCRRYTQMILPRTMILNHIQEEGH